MRCFHVTSSRNRESIRTHGLDWSRMGAAPGIAGSRSPEIDGVFLCRDRFEADFFLGFDNGHRPFDVWAVDDVDEADLTDDDTGYLHVAHRIEPHRLTLTDEDVDVAPPVPTGPGGAYGSTLTVTLDDGTVLTDGDALDLLARRTGRDD